LLFGRCFIDYSRIFAAARLPDLKLPLGPQMAGNDKCQNQRHYCAQRVGNNNPRFHLSTFPESGFAGCHDGQTKQRLITSCKLGQHFN
jgi:hypothetical protein